MSDTFSIFLLAAGEAERHNGGNKAALMVGNETVLERTVRLCAPWRHVFRIVTHRPDISHPSVSSMVPEGRRWVTETLFSTSRLWQFMPVIVLLGDVYYTEAAIERIFSTGHTAAFGHDCHIHALRIQPESFNDVQASLKRCVEAAEKHPRHHGAGKLWTFVQCTPNTSTIDFEDETTDFDSPQEHRRFIRKYYASRCTSPAGNDTND